MKELKIFNRTHKYDYEFDIKKDLRVIEELSEKIKEPQILCYCGFDTIEIYIHEDDHHICYDCIHWIYDQTKDKLNEDNIRECLLKCSEEDEEWTKKRNEKLEYIAYRKVTFLPEIQAMVQEKLDEYKNSLNAIYKEFVDEKQKEKEEYERGKCEWTITKTFSKVFPRGDKVDGYIDAEYTSKNGKTIRMVNRDVFDFGCYSYPKRLEGNEDIFDRNLWTEDEKKLSLWLAKYGEFHGIRM